MPSTRSSPRSATGETRTAGGSSCALPAGSAERRTRAAPRRCGARWCRARVRPRWPGSSSRSTGSTTTSASASSPSSFSSGVVNAACAGPRRASRTISFRPEPRIASIAGIGRVGRPDLLRGEREHPDDVDRDVPRADNDRAFAVEVEHELLEVGVAVVPGDELGRRPASRADPRPVCPSADRSARRPRRRPRRTAGQILVREVAADLHVAEEAEARPGGDPLERLRDRLDLRVVGRDSEPDEPPRSRQPLDHVDLNREVGVEQVPRRRTRRGPSRRRRRGAGGHAMILEPGGSGRSGELPATRIRRSTPPARR